MCAQPQRNNWKGRSLVCAGVAALILTLVGPAAAAGCTSEDFTKVIEATGKTLRALNAKSAPRLRARLAKLRARKDGSDSAGRAKAEVHLHDERMAALDRQANALLGQFDQLGEAGAADPPDCNKLPTLKKVAAKLISTVEKKSAYTLAKLDRALGPGVAPQPSTAPSAPTPSPLKPSGKPERRKPDPGSSLKKWKTTTAPAPRPVGPPQSLTPSTRPGSGGWQPTYPPAPQAQTFSLEEIKSASRGFFGTISAGLANVLEHAFSKLGRPSGYVLGKEGGGAFLAGVRYGKGRLFTRGRPARHVFWHGPSIGYDVGAAGSRTMFLVYNLRNERHLFSAFTGIDGSAYLVGGIGITFLTNGKVVMAPIRSGVGLRLGASIGYVRFTTRRTWNPF